MLILKINQKTKQGGGVGCVTVVKVYNLDNAKFKEIGLDEDGDLVIDMKKSMKNKIGYDLLQMENEIVEFLLFDNGTQITKFDYRVLKKDK